ncbi:AMP-binding protein [Vineibacter terrae]|uniref:AMP-binding protein n=1 Tax=Vineibacter terrae TaxID=2586908 RepID=A0A5C8PCZ3_9HYPH|nr:AMP-binding protein [Vineibacter terrae]TXL71622.1 AMP-binding protein [Vineibacter terrae]
MRIIDYFHHGLQRDPQRLAFVDPDKSYTFAQADEMSARIAGGLFAAGTPDGARVAVYSPNDALAFVCIVAAMRLGCPWVPVNVRNPVEVNAAFLRQAGCSVLFFHSSLAADMREIAARTPSVKTIVCIDSQDPAATHSLDILMALEPGPVPEVPDDPDRVIAIVPTGGTTGLSKAAVWTHRTWDAVTAALWTSCPARGAPVHLVAAPMTHGAGAVAMWMIPGGATSVVLRKAEPVAIMEAIQRHRVTHMYLPPTLIYMILAHPDVRQYDYSSLQYLIVAAAPIAPDKFREAMEVFGPCICQSFGQAEAPMLLTFLSTADLLEATAPGAPARFASCGRATLGTRVEIMDDEGNLLPPGRKGEIVARSGMVFQGYLLNPRANEEARRFGWHHTGDVGFKDEQGFVYIVDRKKDMIVTGGFNVFSVEVEQVILGHAAVQDCAVIGVPDTKWGEAIKAVVELKPHAQADAAEIQELVRVRLGGVQVPKSVEFWEQLPRSNNNKVQKTEIRKRFWEGRERLV